MTKSNRAPKDKQICCYPQAYWLVFFLVLVLGTFLRFYRIRETQNFFYDVARDMEVVRKIIVNKKWTLLGPQTSFGLHSPTETYFGPLYYYLILPALFLSGLDPVGPALLTALFGVLTAVFLFVFLIRLTKNKWLSLGGFFLYLASPLVIEYSRFPWNPNFIPFFVALLFLFLQKHLKKPRLLLVLSIGFISGLLFQLHYVTLGVILATGFSLLFFRPQKFIRPTLALLFGFILGILPMILFEFRHQFFLSKGIINNLAHRPSNLSFSLGKVFIYLRSFLGRFFGLDSYSLVTMEASTSLASLFLAIIFLSLIIFLLKKGKKDKSMVFSLILAFGLGLFSAPFYSQFQFQRIEDRYLLPIIPVFLSLLIVSVQKIIDFFAPKPSFRKIIFTLIILAFISLSFFSLKKDWQIISAKISIDSHQVNLEGTRQIAQIISQDVRKNNLQGKFNLANIVDGNTRGIYYRYFLELNQTPAMRVEDYPRAEVLYVLSKEDADFVLNYPVWEINSFLPQAVADHWLGPFGVKVYKLVKE